MRIDGLESTTTTGHPPLQALLPSTAFKPLPSTMPRRRARLASVMLLSGNVRQSRLPAATGRSSLDLPVCDGLSVLDLWRDQLVRFASRLSLPAVPCRLLIGSNSPVPSVGGALDLPQLTIEPDPAQLRGTGGLLRDLAESYDDDDLLIVASAAQLLLEPVEWFAEASILNGADVTILEDQASAPASLFTIACRALRTISRVGFVDLKEQALPRIAQSHCVRVINHPGPVSMPLRTAAGYLAAVHEYHRRRTCTSGPPSAFVERWRSQFSIVEPGAAVHPQARLHNSVVLHGASVAAGCDVANSIICPGARIGRRSQVLDRVVTASGSFSTCEQ